MSERDDQRLEKVLEEKLSPFGKGNANLVIFNLHNFYDECGLHSLRKEKFLGALDDVLSGSSLAQKIGTWVVAQVESPVFVLVRIVPAGASRYALEANIAEEISKGNIAVIRSSSPRASWASIGL